MSLEAEVTKEVVEQANFISTLGLNWKLFVAQIVNFSVIVLVLWKWAYKPLVKMMDERSATIEKSLNDAKQIEENLKKTNEERERILLQAKKEAQDMLSATIKNAERLRAEMASKAKAETEKLVAQTKQSLAHEKEQLLTEVKAEVAELVVAATGKVLQEKIDSKKDRELVEAVVSSM